MIDLKVWDENKNSENIAKHKVSFEKAQDAFSNEKRIILEVASRKETL
ncbi:BrnT family toxin [Treponema rectale]|uniref:BrnT family toxin n=1 Tax=Treponema rectale TaxID=744512 RepID=A0A7M1XSZ3_9SPIR|nr:BrnT family toxin [Treponema rectale]